ncbi:MAG: paraquat-inducible protein A [Pseudomonadota bacterium]|nr:paraquat-inducible protein A [Pseudomonadota bacterium]
MRAISAARFGLLACHACGLLHRSTAQTHASMCRRCGARLHPRKPASVARTSALLISAYLLYIPANVLPVMETGSLFGAQTDTIMSGVVFLVVTGSWPLAALIFFASIVVPLAKLGALTVLTVSVQRRATWAPERRARIFRIVAFIGRWSMLDIFVAAILAALVQFQAFATIRAGPGAIAFGAVVVLTMFAAETFDPRLIWDPIEERRG